MVAQQHTNRQTKRRGTFFLCGFFVLFFLSGILLSTAKAQAATICWTGGTSTAWATGSNWVGGVAPANDATTDIACFNQTSYTNLPTIGNASRSIAGIVIGDGSTATATLTIASGGGTRILTIGASGVDMKANAGAVTISAPVTLGAAQTWQNASNNLLTFSGAVANGGFLLTVGGAGNTTVSGIISGTGGITKNGAGTLTLSGATNSYTGLNTLNAGIVKVSIERNLGAAANDVTFGGGTLQVTAGFTATSTKILTVNAGTTGTLSVNTGQTLTLSTATTVVASTTSTLILSGAGTVAISAAQTTFDGTLRVDAGTLIISGSTSVIGDTTNRATLTLNGGTVSINDSTARAFSANLSVTADSTIIPNRAAGGAGVTHSFNSTSMGAYTLSVNGGANVTSGTEQLTFGALTLSGSATINTTLPANGGIMLSSIGAVSGNTYSLTIGGTGNTNVTGIIGTTSGAVTKNDAGTLTLSGANTFSGGLTINAGTVSGTTSTSAFGNSGTGAITLGATSGSADATLSHGLASSSYANPITVASGSSGNTLKITCGDVAAPVFSGAITLNNNITVASATTRTLTLSGGVTGTGNITASSTGTSAAITFSNTSVNNAGTVTNSTTTSGTLTISGGVGSNVTGIIENSATSALTISTTALTVNGTMTTLTNSNASGSSVLTLSGGTTGTGHLTLNNNSAIAAGITVSGTTVNHTGTLTNSGTGSGTTTVSAIIGSSVTTVTQNSTTGSTLTLSGANTFTGGSGLVIKAGTVIGATSDKAFGGNGTGAVVLGNTSGSDAASLLVSTTGLNYANPVTLATGTSGTLTMGNTGTSISTTFSGGVTGTNNLTVNSNATDGTITFSTANINNTGTLTFLGAGSGTTTVSSNIGPAVTTLTQNSSTAALSATGTVSVSALTVTAGTCTAANSVTVSGDTSVTGTLTISSATGTKTLSGNVTINNGGIWNNTAANEDVSIGGNLQNDGTLNAGTGVYTLTGTTKTISGANTVTIPSVAISGSYTNNGTLTIATALTGAGSLTQGTNSTLNIAASDANFTISTFTASASGNTVNYNGTGAQTMKAVNYYNLTGSSVGLRTLASSGTIGVAGTFTPGSNTYTVTGSTVDFNGTGAQTIPAFNYNNLTVSGARTSNSVTLASSDTIGIAGTFSPTATFTSGAYINTGSTVYFNGSGSQTIPAFNYNNLTGSTPTFPRTPILDTFNRANQAPTMTNWGSMYTGLTGEFEVTSQQATVDSLGSAGAAANYWNVSTFGPDSEVYAKVVTVPTVASGTTLYLFLRLTTPTTLTPDGYYVSVNTGGYSLLRVDNGAGTLLGSAVALTINDGDSVGLRMVGSTLTFYYKSGSGEWTAGESRTDGTYTGAGSLAIGTNGLTPVIDDFGGGTSSSPSPRTLASSGTIGVAGTFTPGTSSYTVTGSTVNFNGGATQTVNAGFTYNNLQVQPSANSVTTNFAAGTVTVGGDLTIGNGTNTSVVVNANNSSTTLTVAGSVSIAANTTLQANASNNFTIGDDFTNNGTFTHNNGTVVLNTAAKTSSLNYTADTTFYNLSITTAGKTVEFDEAQMTTVTHNFTVTGTDCTTGRVFLKSVTNGNQWDITVTGATVSIGYADVHDGNAVTTAITASNSTADSDNNTNWTVSGGTCGGNANPNVPASLTQKNGSDVAITEQAWTNSNTPKLGFTITDPDSGNTVKYRVQVATDSGFSSLVLDYTHGSLSASGTTFTFIVGTYTGGTCTGTCPATLSDSSGGYWWRVKAIDNSAAESAFVEPGVAGTVDFKVDATTPTGGSAYDGTSGDQDWNDGSLTSISGNWTGVDATVSGVQKYEYAIRRKPDDYYWSVCSGSGSWQAGALWCDNATSTSFTQNTLNLATGVTYYISVRTTDNAGNVGTAINSNGQHVLPMLSFSLSGNTVAFSNLNVANSYTDTKTITTTTSTNAANGYTIKVYNTDFLRASPSITIPDFSGTWSSPATWSGGQYGFGYTSDDTSVQGSNRFSGGTAFAAFSQSPPGDVVADHTTAVDGSTGSVSSEHFTITYKVAASTSQDALYYQTSSIFIVTANY